MGDSQAPSLFSCFTGSSRHPLTGLLMVLTRNDHMVLGKIGPFEVNVSHGRASKDERSLGGEITHYLIFHQDCKLSPTRRSWLAT